MSPDLHFPPELFLGFPSTQFGLLCEAWDVACGHIGEAIRSGVALAFEALERPGFAASELWWRRDVREPGSVLGQGCRISLGQFSEAIRLRICPEI